MYYARIRFVGGEVFMAVATFGVSHCAGEGDTSDACRRWVGLAS